MGRRSECIQADPKSWNRMSAAAQQDIINEMTAARRRKRVSLRRRVKSHVAKDKAV